MYILLDIDGVMIITPPWRKLIINTNDGFPEFDHIAVANLNKILTETKANIILTTTHKYEYTLYQWIDIFNNRGIKIKDIDRLEQNHGNINRKYEILNWSFQGNDLLNYVIIDDDKTLNGLPKGMKDRLVQTHHLIGLTEENANKAIEILKTTIFYDTKPR